MPGFATKKSIRKAPVIGVTCIMLGCIFISRGASEEKRIQTINQLIERQDKIERDPTYSQIVVFPEGGTSNSRYILNFKKGGFAGLKTVQPIVLKYEWKTFSPAYDVAPFFPQVLM
jgi:lysophosphatidylcholine acyltransferase / lyso-PAF acetyltransferase